MRFGLLNQLNMSKVALSVTALAAALSSCGAQQNKVAESDVKIVGGEPVPDTQNDARRLSTVALTTDYAREAAKPSTIEQNHSFCSGTLIGRRVVMTAAHCLAEFDQKTRRTTGKLILPETKDFIVHFDVEVKKSGRWVRAAKVIPHPDWDPAETLSPTPSKPANDIGLIILEADAPAHMKPVSLADTSVAIDTGVKVDLVGYGVTLSRNNNDTGILRQVKVGVTKLDTVGLKIQVQEFLHGACAGDSGGPLYVEKNGQLLVAGATSTGAEIAGLCLGLSNFYTDARHYGDWIRSVASLH